MKRYQPVFEQRGMGLGRGGLRQGDGGATKCICPQCGYEVPHERGIPCREQKCPKCNILMIGK